MSEKIKKVEKKFKDAILRDSLEGAATGAAIGIAAGPAGTVGGAAIGTINGARKGFIEGAKELVNVLEENASTPEQVAKVNALKTTIKVADIGTTLYDIARNSDNCLIM